MKFDTFMKVTLLLIVLFLGIIALRPPIELGSALANPGGKFDYIQVWAMSYTLPGLPRVGHIILFDTRDGSVWAYSDNAMVGNESPAYVGKLTELGKPIVKK